MLWPRAAAHAAAAAGKAGTVYILSTLSGTPLEEVKAATTGPCWFPALSLRRARRRARRIARAKAAGFSAIVVTIDTPVAGMRERDVRNGTRQLLSGKPMLPHLPQMLVCPRWLYDFFADGGLMSFPNVMLADGPMKYAEVGAALGARAVLLGRGYSYGLAALGEAGATRAAEIFRADLLRTMKLLGWRLEEGPRRRCGSRQSGARRGTAPRAAVRRGP